MHSSITIDNQMNTLVKYKVNKLVNQIKTNKPGLYLVKPMEGQILCHSNTTIAFKRK